MEETQRPFRLDWIPAGTVRTNPDQWVEHPNDQLSRLRAILFGQHAPGWAGATVVNERLPEKGWAAEACGYYFVDGHARDQVAQEFAADVPALIGQWTPAEEKTLIALINPLAMMARAVPEKQLAVLQSAAALAQDPVILEALEDLLVDAQTAYNALAALAEAAGEGDAEPQMERAEELRQEWGVEPGQLWQLGQHLLICGDCTDPAVVQRLMGEERAVLFNTDPPYLVGYDGTNHPQSWKKPARQRLNANKDWSSSYHDWDSPEQGEELYDGFVAAAIAHAITEDAAWYCWHASQNQAMVERVWEKHGAFVHQQIIWAKSRPILTRSWYMWQHEPCFFGWIKGKKPKRTSDDHPTTVWNIASPTAFEQTDHPTSKPLELFMIPMTQHTGPGEICYEPFSGSGSQLLAAERLGRVCRAIEIHPGYVAVALQRFLDATGIQPLLMGSG